MKRKIFIAIVASLNLMFCVQAQNRTEQVNEEGVISFFPFGTLTIRTTSGEEYKAILNTVSGFPVSLYKDGTSYKLELDAFSRADFLFQKKDEYNKTFLTIRTYNEHNKETVFIKDYEVSSYSSIGAISFLTDKGMRFLSLNQVEQMTKDENKTPKMPANIQYVYIRSGGMVYKVPQPLLTYEHIESGGMSGPSKTIYYGIPYGGGDIFRTNSLKYIRICKEVEGFRKTNNSVYVNVYFTDNSMISTTLLCNSYYNSTIVAPTALGEIRSMIANVDDIFFGNYDLNFAKKVAADKWDRSKKIPFIGKGTATVYKNDNGKKSMSVFALNTLGAIGGGGNSGGGYFSQTPTAYLGIPDLERTKKGTDVQLLFFPDIKSLNIKKIDDNLIMEYLLYSGETGEKLIKGNQLEGLTEDGKERIDWKNIEKIDFDKNRNVDLSQIKKAIITDKNGCVFETLQPMLYFGYSASWGTQTVNIEGGLSVTYDKIKKIEFLPTKKEGDKTLYPAKFTLRDGSSQKLLLKIGGYYNDYLQFLTSIGGLSLNLRNDVESIEFMW